MHRDVNYCMTSWRTPSDIKMIRYKDENCDFAARLDPRVVHTLRARFARDEIINSLRSALREELTITEISKEDHASRVAKILNHASRYYAESRLTRIIWARSRITLIILVPSCVTENPFATLSLETPASYSDGHSEG